MRSLFAALALCGLLLSASRAVASDETNHGTRVQHKLHGQVVDLSGE